MGILGGQAGVVIDFANMQRDEWLDLIKAECLLQRRPQPGCSSPFIFLLPKIPT